MPTLRGVKKTLTAAAVSLAALTLALAPAANAGSPEFTPGRCPLGTAWYTVDTVHGICVTPQQVKLIVVPKGRTMAAWAVRDSMRSCSRPRTAVAVNRGSQLIGSTCRNRR